MAGPLRQLLLPALLWTVPAGPGRSSGQRPVPADRCGCRNRPRHRCQLLAVTADHRGPRQTPRIVDVDRHCGEISLVRDYCRRISPRRVLSDDTAGRGGGHRENTAANIELVIGPSSRVDHWRPVENRLVGRDARDRPAGRPARAGRAEIEAGSAERADGGGDVRETRLRHASTASRLGSMI